MIRYAPMTPKDFYTAEQVRAIDRWAIEQLHIPGIELMQRAADAAIDVINARWPSATNIAVICGTGNNAGDGYLIAAGLHALGRAVTVVAVTDPATLGGDAAAAYQTWIATQQATVTDPIALADYDLIVDALFGIGLNRPLINHYADAVQHMQDAAAQGLPILAVDCPSGLDVNTGSTDRVAPATVTVTYIARKRGLFTGRGRSVSGEVVLATLGLPSDICQRALNVTAGKVPDYVQEHNSQKNSGQNPEKNPRQNPEQNPGQPHVSWLLMPAEHSLQSNAPLMAAREVASHKGSHGTLLLIGGNQGMEGALVLATEAAMRTGVGKAVACHRGSCQTVLLSRMPAAMHQVLKSDQAITQQLNKWSTAPSVAMAVGPGLGSDEWAQHIMGALPEHLAQGLPMVLDADALNYLAAQSQPVLLGSQVVITPHPAEAARLLNCSTAAVESDRFAAVQALAKRFACVVVLKGAGTLVTDGHVGYICERGNPGMAVAGMGDSLTGVIGSLLAQGYSAFAAASLGTWLHSRAADLAVSQGKGERGLLPQDLTPYLQELVNT